MDIRYALRSFSRQPLFAAIAIGLLTLFVGINAAVFSLVDAVLFKPLPVKSPDEFATVNGEQRDFSYLIFDRLRLQTANLSSSPFAINDGAVVETALAKSRTPIQVKAPLVAREYLRAGSVKANTGHKLTSRGDQADGPGIAELTYECPFSRNKVVITRQVSQKQKLLIIINLTQVGLSDEPAERPDNIETRFDCPADYHADGTAGSSVLPHEDRSTTRAAVRNQICVRLVGRKVEAQDEDQEPDNGQTPAPPPERAQEWRR